MWQHVRSSGEVRSWGTAVLGSLASDRHINRQVMKLALDIKRQTDIPTDMAMEVMKQALDIKHQTDISTDLVVEAMKQDLNRHGCGGDEASTRN